MALCATTALAGAVPRLCVRGARGRFGGFGPVLGVVSLSFPPPRPACSALCVAGRPTSEWRLVPLGHSNWKSNQTRSNYSTYDQELLAGMLVLSAQSRLLGSNPIV